MKMSLLTTGLGLALLSNIASAAVLLNNPASPVQIFSSDVIGSSAEYRVFRYRFDIYNPINIRYFTPSFADFSYQNAAVALTNAVRNATTPAVNLQFQISPITNLAQPYNNTVIFYEMDTGQDYLAAAIGFNSALQPCAELVDLRIDPTFSYFEAIELGQGALTRNCDNQTINTGLVVFNTADWNSMFQPGGHRDPTLLRNDLILSNGNWIPPFAEQQHLIMHEFTHLLGLGHIDNRYDIESTCSSVMTSTLFGYCRDNPAPTIFTADDLNLLDQLY